MIRSMDARCGFGDRLVSQDGCVNGGNGMALEKSILDENGIRQLLAEEYGLHMTGIAHLPLGSAHCYRVRCEEGIYFFKEYPGEFSLDTVKKEAALVDYLCAKTFPAARFIRTKGRDFCLQVDGHVVAVQEFIEGRSFLNDMPRRYMADCAKYLGLLHHILKDYPMENSMDESWLNNATAENNERRFDDLLDALEEQKSDPHYEKIRDEVLFKKNMAKKIEDMRGYFEGITYTQSHGDYTACQLICDDEHVKAVIDFAAATKVPAVWEIMRSYVQSFGACRDGAPFNTEELCDYVREYMKYADLSQQDLIALPYVYLVQLARSRYGYKEYVILKTENKDALLEFASWRTNVCREIYNNAEKISAALSELAGALVPDKD